MSETNTVERPVKPPVRAYRLTMALEADTRTDMAWALRNLANRIEAEKVTIGVWGGPSDGAIYELLADPSMTHDSYHAALRDYLNDKRSPAFTTGHCAEKKKPGGCQLHNLHCGYPECDKRFNAELCGGTSATNAVLNGKT